MCHELLRFKSRWGFLAWRHRSPSRVLAGTALWRPEAERESEPESRRVSEGPSWAQIGCRLGACGRCGHKGCALHRLASPLRPAPPLLLCAGLDSEPDHDGLAWPLPLPRLKDVGPSEIGGWLRGTRRCEKLKRSPSKHPSGAPSPSALQPRSPQACGRENFAGVASLVAPSLSLTLSLSCSLAPD